MTTSYYCGALVPSTFVPDVPTCHQLVVVSIIWGIALGLILFGLIRAAGQTLQQWRRVRKVTAYMVFVWTFLVVSSIMGGVTWGYIAQKIPPSFQLFFFVVILWCFQVHCLMQIIINRIALLSLSRTATVGRIRWGVFAILVLVNISVFCIWIPSRLQISPRWHDINHYWDRCEKAIFAAIDVALNCYFVYLVRSSLVAYGLVKYIPLYRVNIALIFVSLSMDVIIIGTMSLRNSFVYMIFQTMAYLVKLHIELSMADLIRKIVKASSNSSSSFSNCPCACTRCTCCSSSHDFPFSSSSTGRRRPSAHADSATSPIAPTTGRLRKTWPFRKGRARRVGTSGGAGGNIGPVPLDASGGSSSPDTNEPNAGRSESRTKRMIPLIRGRSKKPESSESDLDRAGGQPRGPDAV